MSQLNTSLHPPQRTTYTAPPKSSDHHAKHLSQNNITTSPSQKFPDTNLPIPVPSFAPSCKTPVPAPCTSITNDAAEHVKLFFERFPSWVDYQDLKRAFFKLGRVIKLFVSKRKTVLGRRFGFVDISSSLSVTTLCDQASRIWFDTYKLIVNPAKHHSLKTSPSPPKHVPKPATPYHPQLSLIDHRSFAEVLTNTKPQIATTRRRMVQYESTEEDKEWLYRSLVGNILPNVDVATLEATILKSVANTVSFRFLGASQVIITFTDQLASKKEQDNEGSILKSLFSNLRQWEGRTRAYDRFAWIAIFGLPMEGWNRNCFDTILQSWGTIAGYDTTCVSQGSISGIGVLIRTIKMEPLHDEVSLKLDGIQVEVLLNEIKGEFIPSLTTVKHSMDVSLYTESVLSDDEEEQTETISAASIPRATRQNTEFEFICTLGNQDQNDSTFLNTGISPLCLHPEITELCSHAILPEELVYEDGNHLALVLYDCAWVATADVREGDEQQVVCMLERDGLDQQKGYNSGDVKKMGREKKQKPFRLDQHKGNSGSSSIGPSFANFIIPIADQTELSDLELQNRRSQRNKAKKLSRRAPTVKRRKPRKMGNQSSKKTELGIIDYSVSDNGIMNRNVIIRSGKEIAGEDEVSSSHSHISPTSSDPAREPLQPDPREEATACWDVGKAVLQVHDESHLMTQTLQSFIEKEQEEWMRRKEQ